MTHDVARSKANREQLLTELRNRDVKLSILMPAYNEDRTIAAAVEAVLNQHYPCPIELIVVDDGSKRPVKELVSYIEDPRLRVHRHRVNLGKGAALRQAAALATGTHLVPFDADLEYDPADLGPMLEPVLEGRSHVVYGTRLFGVNTRYQSYIHGFSNRTLTLAANLLYDAYMSDLHTCLKLMPLDVFRSFPLRESGFGLDTEITAWLLRAGLRPFEVPVSYHSRSRESGKKINWRDGVECLRVLGRVRRSQRLTISPYFADPQQGHLAAVEALNEGDDELAMRRADPLRELSNELAARGRHHRLNGLDPQESGQTEDQRERAEWTGNDRRRSGQGRRAYERVRAQA